MNIAHATNAAGDIVPKYYIQSGTLQLIYSTSEKPFNAAVAALWETNKFDVLDEHFYIDERGMKNHMTALPDTTVIKSNKVFKKAGWEIG
jgi:hypothetical protein